MTTRRGLSTADRAFRGLAVTASAGVLLVVAAIGLFLVAKAIPALHGNTGSFLVDQVWHPDGDPPIFGIAAALYFTILTSIIAMILAVPVALTAALFITFYAPRRLSACLGYLVELLAAVPSIVYGLWGFAFLAPHLSGLVRWLDHWFGWTGVLSYRPDNAPNSYSPMAAGIVLAIMILPTISSISRECFRRVPADEVDAALALGASRAEMLGLAVLPVSKPGVIAASLLGLSRALGETLAVTLILSTMFAISFHITESGGVTLAAVIALKYGEAGEVGTGALIAVGLCLFVLTLGVNLVASMIVNRRRAEVNR
jgi:phosphate transport system permease protein